MTEIERQRDIERLVGREIYTCQTYLVEQAFSRRFFSHEEIENFYRPFDGKLLSPNICFSCNNVSEALDSETGSCEACYEEHAEPQEIFEWWLVSKWFAYKLSTKGEPILTNAYGMWWGRTTTGQAIAMDSVIQAMYDEIVQ